MPGISETEFMAQVLELARLHRWKVYHTHDSRHSEEGFPDLVLVRRKLIFAELKVGKGKVTPAQQWWINDLILAGQEVYVWRPETDWPEIERVLAAE